MPSGLFADSAKQSVAAAVAKAEAHTAAEFVIALRHASGRYRDVEYVLGFALAILALCALLFLPQDFTTDYWPPALVIVFFGGTALAGGIAPLRRALTSRSRRRAQVQLAARAAFYELGVGRTRNRTGVLVFISVFEKVIEVVPDLGVELKNAGPKGDAAIAALEIAASNNDLAGFATALESLGAAIGEFLPRHADDVNELPDAPDAA